MSHPQQNHTQRQFSPPQASSPSPSSTTAPAGYPLPQAKRPKVSPVLPQQIAQPASPYVNPAQYAASPTSSIPTSSIPTPAPVASPSPGMPPHSTPSAIYPPVNAYNTAQTNGRFAPMAPAPAAQPTPSQSPLGSPLAPNQGVRPASQTLQSPVPTATTTATPVPLPQYSHAQLAPMSTAVPATSNMGPPATYPASSLPAPKDTSKQPASKPTVSKVNAYEMNDMLMGTGVDLEEEAELLNESRSGFSHLPSGGRDTLYGAGRANQPGEATNEQSTEDLEKETADRAWLAAASRLAVSRSQELKYSSLEPGVLHHRMHTISQKFGLELNLELKPDGQTKTMGRTFQPDEAQRPEIKVSVQTAPDGLILQTHGSIIPKDAYLADQILLLSMATRERLRDLLTDANKIANARQTTAHGFVPAEWADTVVSPSEDTEMRRGSRGSPGASPRKRSSAGINNGEAHAADTKVLPPNELVNSIVALGKRSRDLEEARLKKRQKRQKAAEKAEEENGTGASGDSGTIAPDGETRSQSKKDKRSAGKAAESTTKTDMQKSNNTVALFTRYNKYAWTRAGRMNGGSGYQGPGGHNASKGQNGPLTKAGVAHLGQLREDSKKGKKIQLRDWIVTLEDRGLDPRQLQVAYSHVDKSSTGYNITNKSP